MKQLNWKSKETRERYREVINVFTDDWPTMSMVNEYLDGDDHNLQDFCATNSVYFWMTGIGILDAAHLMVDGAFENANIDEEGRIL